MEMIYSTYKGRTFSYGIGTYEEIEALNVKKDFDEVLDTLYAILLEAHHFLGIKGEMSVDRTIVTLRDTDGTILKSFGNGQSNK